MDWSAYFDFGRSVCVVCEPIMYGATVNQLELETVSPGAVPRAASNPWRKTLAAAVVSGAACFAFSAMSSASSSAASSSSSRGSSWHAESAPAVEHLASEATAEAAASAAASVASVTSTSSASADADVHVNGRDDDELQDDDSGVTAIFKHTRPTDLLSADSAFMYSYIANYSDDSHAECEISAKFSTNNFALHFVSSNTTLTGPYNLTYWYAQIRDQPNRNLADTKFVEDYDVFFDDATVFYVGNLTLHAEAFLADDAVRILPRTYIGTDDDALGDYTWYSLMVTTPSGKVMQIISEVLDEGTIAKIPFVAWKEDEAVETQYVSFNTPSHLAGLYADYTDRANGLPELMTIGMRVPASDGDVSDVAAFVRGPFNVSLEVDTMHVRTNYSYTIVKANSYTSDSSKHSNATTNVTVMTVTDDDDAVVNVTKKVNVTTVTDDTVVQRGDDDVVVSHNKTIVDDFTVVDDKTVVNTRDDDVTTTTGTTRDWAIITVVYVQNQMAGGQSLLKSFSDYVESVHQCAMHSSTDVKRQGWDRWMDYHMGVVTTVTGLDRYYHDLIAENVSFHSHAKFDGYDTIHTTSPAAFSIELNGEFESHALTTPNAFDYCTWDTEDAKFSLSTPPQFEGCNIKY